MFGTLAAAGISFLAGMFRFSSVILFLSNLIGFLASIVFLFGFAGRELLFFKTDSFFALHFSLNYLSAIFLTLVSGISGLVAIYGVEYLNRFKNIYNINNVQALISVFVFGMGGVLLVGNIVGFMIFWEIMSFASFFLVMSDHTRESSRAAFIYLIMTHLGAGAIFGGFLLLSGGSLGFELSEIAVASKNISPNLAVLAFLLLFFGFGSKAGLIPFHIWLPEAHPQAPTNVSALMSGLMLKIAIYGFIKTALVFFDLPVWTTVLVMALGIISALLGALHAVVEKDIKKAFAYSSIENMGIIFLMLGVAMYIISKESAIDIPMTAVSLITFAVFHAINHAVFKTGLFLSSGVIISKTHSKSLDVMGGIAKKMPTFSFIFMVIILTSAALPPLGTFYGEWGFIRSIIELLHIYGTSLASVSIFLIILSAFSLASGLAVFAMVRIFGLSMLGLSRNEIKNEEKNNDTLLIFPLAIIGAVIAFLGVFAGDILRELSDNLSGAIFAKSESSAVILISSVQLFGAVIVFLILAIFVRKIVLRKNKREREYQTWDCGQPINSGMEYTATAFSAPIRFYFLPLLRRNKQIVSVPVVSSNPWIVNTTFSLNITSAWQQKIYRPAIEYVFWLAEKIRLLHAGRIQYYLLFLLVSIIITLIIAL